MKTERFNSRFVVCQTEREEMFNRWEDECLNMGDVISSRMNK